MVIPKEVKLIQKYLEAMPTLPSISPQNIESATLKDLRPRALTQSALGKELERDRATISNWERGVGTDRIKPAEIVKLALLFKRDVVEILAAIENTQKKLAKEEGEGK